jgi:hypothetical protein
MPYPDIEVLVQLPNASFHPSATTALPNAFPYPNPPLPLPFLSRVIHPNLPLFLPSNSTHPTHVVWTPHRRRTRQQRPRHDRSGRRTVCSGTVERLGHQLRFGGRARGSAFLGGARSEGRGGCHRRSGFFSTRGLDREFRFVFVRLLPVLLFLGEGIRFLLPRAS